MNGFGSGDIFAPDVNNVPVRNVYPTAPGGSLGTVAAATSPDTSGYGVKGSLTGTGGAATTPGVPTLTGHPVTWYLGLLGVIIAMVFIAKKTGQASEFSNLRASFYNVSFIGLTATLFLVLAKIIVSKFRVPGLTEIILAA